jgi:phage head maturation protease
MPLPEPGNESRDEFLERCMADEIMNDEYPDTDQRYAVCNSLWRDKAMLDIERKSFHSEFKAGEEEGSFLCQFATFDAIDLDGDVTIRGAFPEGKEILVSAYQHGSWMGALPVGKAIVHEQTGEAVAEGKFNLQMTSGRETYESVKFSGALQEWSYGFRVLESGSDKELDSWAEAHDGARPMRIIKKVEPYEVSPVLKGAGVATATLDIKSGLSYADHTEAVLAAVNSVAERTRSLADLRRKDGRDLSQSNRERIVKLLATLDEVKASLTDAITVAEPIDEKAVLAAFAEFNRINLSLEV